MNLSPFNRRTRLALVLALLVGVPSLQADLGAAASQFIRGDANDDGEITLADVVHVTAYLYGAGPAPLPVVESGDANCDNIVGPRDIVYLINFILRGGPKPKCPT